jgi:hypothetical protein
VTQHLQQPVVVDGVEGNHDTIPIPKTFHNPLPLPGNAIPLKVKHYRH